tara:strand:- start:34 stop:321 length:288 start_codon:yes stop_codon:yes gene_type:complete
MVLGNIEVERKKRIFDTEGNVTTESIDVSWELVRAYRDAYLSKSDLWVLLDRYNTLTDSQKTELTTYRQALRDLPSAYTESNDAADNFPTAPSWL